MARPGSGKQMTRGTPAALAGYDVLLSDVVNVIEEARRAAAHAVNAVMTATYWLIGRRIVEEEAGRARAAYGEALLERLAEDLTERFRRGFSRQNLQKMRLFYLAYPPERIRQTLSDESRAMMNARRRRTTFDFHGIPSAVICS